MMSEEYVAAFVSTLEGNLNQVTFEMNFEDWASEHIKQFLESLQQQAINKGYKVVGVRSSGDIYLRLQPSQKISESTFLHNGIPIVQTADFGVVEVVVRKQ